MILRARRACAETQGGEKQEDAKRSAHNGTSVTNFVAMSNGTPAVCAWRDCARMYGLRRLCSGGARWLLAITLLLVLGHASGNRLPLHV